MFLCLAVDGISSPDTDLKSAHLYVFNEKWPIHIAVGKVQPYEALAIPGDKPAVSHRAIIVCIELECYCAGIAMADIEGQIVHVVMEPVR